MTPPTFPSATGPNALSLAASLSAIFLAIWILGRESEALLALGLGVILASLGTLLPAGVMRRTLAVAAIGSAAAALLLHPGLGLLNEILAMAMLALAVLATGAEGMLQRWRHAVIPGMLVASTDLFAILFGAKLSEEVAAGGSPALSFALIGLSVAIASLQRLQHPWDTLNGKGKGMRSARRVVLVGFAILVLSAGAQLIAPTVGFFDTPHLLAFAAAINVALLGGFALGEARREKKARRELQLSEERFRALFDMAPDGALLLSADGRIEMVNHQLQRLVGYSGDELLGKDVEFLLPGSEEDTYRKVSQRKDAAKRRSLRAQPLEVRHADGTMIPVDLTFSAIESQPDSPVKVSLRDVREQTAALEKLEVQSRLLDQVGEAVIATDRNGRVTFWNRAAETIYGWQAEEALGQPILELIPAEASTEEAAAILESLVVKSGWSGRVQVKRRDGSTFWASITDAVIRDEEGAITSFVGVSRDATDEFRHEQELRLRDQRMNMVGLATRDVVWDLDPSDGSFWWGGEITTLTGELSAGDFDWWKERIHPDERDEVVRTIEEAIDGDAERWSAEYRFRRHDETWVSILDRGYILRGPDGKAERMIGTMMDISERKTLEAELRRAERLSSLGRLAATVAHEFNNVLMGIQPFADLLSRTAVDEQQERIARQITGSVSRGRRITHDILKFTRPVEAELIPIELGKWLRRGLPEWKAVLGEGIQISVESAEAKLRIEADHNQLDQLVTNLLMNAREAMPDGGKVSLRIGRPAPGTVYRFGAIGSPESFAHLSITDTGDGISEEVIGHIFEPLFTTRREGTGLGLSLCHQIVRQHRGLIFADNDPGGGAAFHVFLPLTSRYLERESEASVVSRDGQRAERAMDVLLIEDDAQVREGISAILELEGIAVRSARTGAEGLEELARALPDAVILDVGLPDVGGVELFQIIERRYPGLGILFSSGHQDLEALERLRRPQVDFLRKPYEMDVLLLALENICTSPRGAVAGVAEDVSGPA
jgi:PAS domain S-box-containing protein